MQKFFKNIELIDSFTRSLDYHKDALQCKQCLKVGQFVSHGFVYKQRSQTVTEPVGKRIFCSNRYGRSGCGSTFRLYLNKEFPSLQYGSAHLFAFISALLANSTIKDAYKKATGANETRNAWRWLNKLERRMIDYRMHLKTRAEIINTPFKSRTRRIQILIPTLARLFAMIDDCPCANYQTLYQVNFV